MVAFIPASVGCTSTFASLSQDQYVLLDVDPSYLAAGSSLVAPWYPLANVTMIVPLLPGWYQMCGMSIQGGFVATGISACIQDQAAGLVVNQLMPASGARVAVPRAVGSSLQAQRFFSKGFQDLLVGYAPLAYFNFDFDYSSPNYAINFSCTSVFSDPSRAITVSSPYAGIYASFVPDTASLAGSICHNYCVGGGAGCGGYDGLVARALSVEWFMRLDACAIAQSCTQGVLMPLGPTASWPNGIVTYSVDRHVTLGTLAVLVRVVDQEDDGEGYCFNNPALDRYRACVDSFFFDYAFAAGVWYHVAVVLDFDPAAAQGGYQPQLLVNGVPQPGLTPLQNSSIGGAVGALMFSYPANLMRNLTLLPPSRQSTIGSTNDETSRLNVFRGIIDEVAVFPRAVTAAEVAARYASRFYVNRPFPTSGSFALVRPAQDCEAVTGGLAAYGLQWTLDPGSADGSLIDIAPAGSDSLAAAAAGPYQLCALQPSGGGGGGVYVPTGLAVTVQQDFVALAVNRARGANGLRSGIPLLGGSTLQLFSNISAGSAQPSSAAAMVSLIPPYADCAAPPDNPDSCAAAAPASGYLPLSADADGNPAFTFVGQACLLGSGTLQLCVLANGSWASTGLAVSPQALLDWVGVNGLRAGGGLRPTAALAANVSLQYGSAAGLEDCVD